MSEARGWAKCAVLGVAALVGASGNRALLAGAALPLDHLIDRVFGALDAAKRARARNLCVRAEAALASLSHTVPPATLESARLTCETLLGRFGVADRRFAELALSAQAAAAEILQQHDFTADEAIELRPVCERLLVCFYESVLGAPELFADLLPHCLATSLCDLARLRAGQEAADAKLSQILHRVSAEKGVPLPPLRAILVQLGDTETAEDADTIATRLQAKADEYLALKSRLDRLTNDDPRVQSLRRDAAARIAAGEFAAADARLAEAEVIDLVVVEELEAAARRRRLSAAETRAERGAAARLRLDYRTAAAHFAEAVALLPPDAKADRFRYQIEQANCLYELGELRGDNGALVEAVDLLSQMRDETPRATRPLDWAATQNNIANALASLGRRESGTVHLSEAVATYRAALGEYIRERVPLDWAMTQHNLGIALATLGEREGGTARLEEAVTAHRAALEEYSREHAPLMWANCQNSLGTALSRLGRYESGTARLEEAVIAFRAALQVCAREDQPLLWAMLQTSLGNALAMLGWRQSDTARLEKAVAAHRLALRERTRDRVPVEWAATQNNLGNVLLLLGEREGGTVRLGEAIAAYRCALTERTRDRAPLDWAKTQFNLAFALLLKAQRVGDPEVLHEAMDCLNSAREVFVDEDVQSHLATDFDRRIAAIGGTIRPLSPGD